MCEKGPQYALSREARYSKTDLPLLTRQVEEIVVNVSTVDSAQPNPGGVVALSG